VHRVGEGTHFRGTVPPVLYVINSGEGHLMTPQ
jgi:hypothetical protein